MPKHFQSDSEREHYCSPYFVLIANEKDLFVRLNLQFQKQGFIAVATKPNQHVFYINAQQSPSIISSKILHLLSDQEFFWPQIGNNYHAFCIARRKLKHALLQYLGLDESLLGYAVLKYIGEHMNCPPKNLKPFNQNIYPQVAAYFAVNVNQISRAVNYTLSKAKYKGNTMDVLNIIYCYLNSLASKPDLVKRLGVDSRDLTAKEAILLLRNLERNILANNEGNTEISYKECA